MAGHGRKKRRVLPQDQEAARRKFMAALEAQRSNARSHEINKVVAPQAALPGFYYDEAKRRYFRNLPANERQHRNEEETHQQTIGLISDIQVKSRPRHSHTWVAYLAQRQADSAWSARRQDSRKLMPKLITQFVVSQEVKSQDLNKDGRLTALALHPRVSKTGAIGASNGTWQVLGLQRLPGFVARSQCALSIYDSYCPGVVTSLQWRPVQALDILVCHIGTAQRSDSVVFLRIDDHVPQGHIRMSTARKTKTCFYNPWIAKWFGFTHMSFLNVRKNTKAFLLLVYYDRNPSDTRKISIGHGDHDRPRTQSRAAYMDIEAENNVYQCAPKGLITSDVHAQSFFSTGNVVVNGTKGGGLWGWDLRTPRRPFELNQEETLNRPASIVDLHVLDDCSQAIVQRSNGELRLLDLRTLKPVIEYMPGAAKRFVPGLRCVIDDSESIVVTGGDIRRPLAINSFNLRQGHLMSSVEVRNAPESEKRSTVVQQVAFKSSHNDTRNDNTPEIWAISRNELFVNDMI